MAEFAPSTERRTIFDKIIRIGEGRVLRQLAAIADQVNALEPTFTDLTDAELTEQTTVFRDRLASGTSLDALLPEAFAAVREASRRTLGMRHFDVQIMGGAALHRGNVAEMKTGQGKTLVATLPAYLNALSGEGVHVVTVNDYLAAYQAELMGRVFATLGMTTGCILSDQTPEQRREQYGKDVTYGTNNEFGFDYLRDNMSSDPTGLVQRGHHFAIVDEVDSILIDEARTPLIISGPAQGDSRQWYLEFATAAARMVAGTHYEVDLKKQTVGILEPGIDLVEDRLGIGNLYLAENTPLISFCQNAIKAKELFTRDKDYVVIDGEVLIVDEHTGRMLAGRRFNEGLHQALEAKEGVTIKAENQTLATITLQNYFRLYTTLSGMTGTAATEAAELNSTYSLGVVAIPTNKTMVRVDAPDLIYKTADGKLAAVVADIAARHRKGQPVLVGTAGVGQSELLSSLLTEAGIPHEVLNAKQHAREATIIALAGRKGAVTVATNMAGRGTDIMLGGNAEALATHTLTDAGLEEGTDEFTAAWAQALTHAQETVATEHADVLALGGLYVLGTERHESRRIDNQLRGRAGRQGDPGESRFYLSLQDDLMARFGSKPIEQMLRASGIPDDQPLESKLVSRAIVSAQAQIEGIHYESRKNVLKYDDVLSRQREVVYTERHAVLHGDDLSDQIAHFLTDTVTSYVTGATSQGRAESWDLTQLWADLGKVYPVEITEAEVLAVAGGLEHVTAELLTAELTSDAAHVYADRTAKIGAVRMRDLERRILLAILDRSWRAHLYEMDYLKEGIGLRSMAQRDPLVEYQNEGFGMFAVMMGVIKEDTVASLFRVPVPEEVPAPALLP